MKVPDIPEDVPLTGDQKQWLNGFFAGLHSQMLVQKGTGRRSLNKASVTILYGTQTGNSESVAYDAAAAAKSHGLGATVMDMDAVEVTALPAMENLLVITSTYGEGEMPDNAQALWNDIGQESAPRLENTRFSVLALGDTSYDTFCQAGVDWDRRLGELGAKRIYSRVDCDVDYEDAAVDWIDSVIPLLASQSGIDAAEPAVIESVAKEKSKYNRKNPFPAKILVNRLLSKPGSTKEIRHYELSLEDAELVYEPGDVLNVIPVNCPKLVDSIIKAIKCEGDEEEPIHGSPLVLRQALLERFEIKLPSKEFIIEIAKRSGDQELNGLLQAGDNNPLTAYLRGRDILDLLLQFPKVDLTAAEFLRLLKPLQHRSYSISSSIKKHPEEVHLTIASVRYQSHGRHHKGVCSTYLADLVEIGEPLRCFFTPNNVFRVPEDDNVAMIMVGPGTGIAPFRAFLEERDARGAPGKNWLLFGDRNAAFDFIYENEMKSMRTQGLITRLDLAFSRDQAEKIYVQHRMHENSREIFAWLEEGGYFFVCGDAYQMAKDVDKALHDIVARDGNMKMDEAMEYIKHLKKEKRYVRDVY